MPRAGQASDGSLPGLPLTLPGLVCPSDMGLGLSRSPACRQASAWSLATLAPRRVGRFRAREGGRSLAGTWGPVTVNGAPCCPLPLALRPLLAPSCEHTLLSPVCGSGAGFSMSLSYALFLAVSRDPGSLDAAEAEGR